MYQISPEGILLEANERYYEMTGHGRYDDSPFAFYDHICDESRDVAEKMWIDLTTDPSVRQAEMRMKSANIIPRDLAGNPIAYWVLVTSQPEIGPDGKIRCVISSNDQYLDLSQHGFGKRKECISADFMFPF